MKQKLGLCCSLIHDPDLLILDEPTTGVDPLARRQFWELIDRIRVRRPTMSVLVATAYMDEAERLRLAGGDERRQGARHGHARRAAHAAPARPRSRRPSSSCCRRRRAAATRSRCITPYEPSGGPPAIEAHGLTQRFGTFTAVDHVNFRIERGEIFGFLGSNGCGKTTTMKMLTGLLPPTEGTALLFGKPVKGGDVESRRHVGFMTQAFSLYTELTVRQNLMLHARLFDLPRRQGRGAGRRSCSTDFGLEPVADTLTESLPLGIRQRLSLAVAVLHEPEMLILDEPTSGVDPVARDGFWELLIRLSREKGVTIFLSTHFMNEAERCDRMSMMHAGKVLAQGPPAELVAERKAQEPRGGLHRLSRGCRRRPNAGNGRRRPPRAAAPAAAPRPPAAAEAHALARPRPVQPRPASGPSPGARRSSCGTTRCAWPSRCSGPILLMIVFGYGISLDVDHLTFAVLDFDGTPGQPPLCR